MSLIKIWKTKGQIIEGIFNSVFKKEHVEEIAKERMEICLACDLYTTEDDGCMVTLTAPCCNKAKGGCGCSLGLKTRSLSSDCPLGKWKAVLSQEEEDALNHKLGI